MTWETGVRSGLGLRTLRFGMTAGTTPLHASRNPRCTRTRGVSLSRRSKPQLACSKPVPLGRLQEWSRTAALAKCTRDASSASSMWARLSLSTQGFRGLGQCGRSRVVSETSPRVRSRWVGTDIHEHRCSSPSSGHRLQQAGQLRKVIETIGLRPEGVLMNHAHRHDARCRQHDEVLPKKSLRAKAHDRSA
jgi:hypothetical protein